MSSLQVVIDAIANPKQVRLSQERASAKSFSGIEPKMKAIRDVSPECMPGVVGVAMHRAASSLSSRATSQQSSREPSRAPSRDRSVSTTPAARPTVHLQRSHSELPIKSPRIQPKSEFTPDITAMDLSTEQIKRNYSCDDLQKWDRSKFALPPLNPMRGFGRYRRAECADPEWCYDNLKKQIKQIEGLPLSQLEMEAMTGVDHESWQALTSGISRRDSFISSPSTATDSSAGQLDTGTRISRGFSPSGSSTRSSVTSHPYGRKGSTLSAMNLAGDVESPPLPCALKRTSTLLSERRASGPLKTIEELQTKAGLKTVMHRKIEKPCDFSPNGDPDSAVATDVEDEEGWTDVPETIPAKVSAIAQMLKEGSKTESSPPSQSQVGLARVRTISSDKKRMRGSPVTLDRNKTIRAVRPDLRRRQSKNQNTHEKKISEPKSQKRKQEEILKESLQSSAGLGLYIPDTRSTQTETQVTKELTKEAPSKTDLNLNDDQKTGLDRQIPTKLEKTKVLYPKPIVEQIGQRTHLAYVAK